MKMGMDVDAKAGMGADFGLGLGLYANADADADIDADVHADVGMGMGLDLEFGTGNESKSNTKSNANTNTNTKSGKARQESNCTMDSLVKACLDSPRRSSKTNSTSNSRPAHNALETPHQIEIRVLCDKIHKLESELEDKKKLLHQLQAQLQDIVTMRETLETENAQLRAKCSPFDSPDLSQDNSFA